MSYCALSLCLAFDEEGLQKCSHQASVVATLELGYGASHGHRAEL